MNPERWQRLKALFAEAVDVGVPHRAAWLDQHCGADLGLRAELESLLVAHARENAIVDQPAAAYVTGSGFAADAVQWKGQRLGPYELVALLGHGGMGEVYRARRVDDEYDKEVAIKLVPAGYQAQFVLQRLRAERQILATLEHPNIARLIDGGASPQGNPYLVMELVEGLPIDQYCDGLPLERRLELFRAVCGAVSYAHQHLVVHRDIKPSNILVTTDGHVKLLDFGIAKLLQPSVGDLTQPPAATLMQTFTPEFASPEQVLGQTITTASDVYSLGVLLYLLLCGRGPYPGKLDNTQEAIRAICESEPLAPGIALKASSPGAPQLPRDLDAICLRALRKEPGKRYFSVEHFSDDVHRYLRGLPVRARGDELNYRVGKFLRRHRLEVVAASLVLLSLIGGIAVSLREARVAEAQRVRAEKHFQSVRKLADTFMFKVHDAIAPLPGAVEARGLLVETALEYLNTLAPEVGDDRSLQLDLAKAYSKVADYQGQAYGAHVGKQREAIASYGKSIELAELVAAADPTDGAAQEVLGLGLRSQGRLLLMTADTKGALETSARAVAIFERLTKLQPGPGSSRNLVSSYLARGVTLDYTGDEAGTRVLMGKAISLMEEVYQNSPKDPDITRQLGVAYSTYAGTLLGPTRDDAAIDELVAAYAKALAVSERVMHESPAANVHVIRNVMTDHSNLTLALNVKGDFREAYAHCQRGRELARLLSTDIGNAQRSIDKAMEETHCARALRGLGEHAESERVTRKVYAILERLEKENDNLYVTFHFGAALELLGSFSERRKDWNRAREQYATALERFTVVQDAVTLDYGDVAWIDQARTGLARVEGRLAER